jgi:hypothetical protein
MISHTPNADEYWKCYHSSNTNVIPYTIVKIICFSRETVFADSNRAGIKFFAGVVMESSHYRDDIGCVRDWAFGKNYDTHWECVTCVNNAYVTRDIYNELEKILCSQ